jgi:hypothetical protein
MASILRQPNMRIDLGAVYVEPYPWAEERLNTATRAFGAFLRFKGLVFRVIRADSVGRTDSLPAVAHLFWDRVLNTYRSPNAG